MKNYAKVGSKPENLLIAPLQESDLQNIHSGVSVQRKNLKKIMSNKIAIARLQRYCISGRHNYLTFNISYMGYA